MAKKTHLLLIALCSLFMKHHEVISHTHPRPKGEISAVYELLGRVLPDYDGPNRFVLKLLDDDTFGCGGESDYFSEEEEEGHFSSLAKTPLCYRLEDVYVDTSPSNNTTTTTTTTLEHKISVTASTVSEVTAGIGWYLRHKCNMTISWDRIGGSTPPMTMTNTSLPPIGSQPIIHHRNTPHSYLMNVCTHSYTLAWHNPSTWISFIDYLALHGINVVLALTGQEEIQYKVFHDHFGLNDTDIRNWFNGPAFLTWSRGQNEYGSDIAGPLPRSFMKDQWMMQRTVILPRLRSLGIIGQLPGFQGNVPKVMKDVMDDVNMTVSGDTGWIDSLDPLFGRIADVWMRILLEDFGPTDHWYQLDGYFDGSTAPWFMDFMGQSQQDVQQDDPQDVQQDDPQDNNNSIPHNDVAFRRATAAYTGLNRTDPHAIWSFQGFAVISWHTIHQASILKSFIDAVPPHKFVIVGMSRNGSGQWRYWNNSMLFGSDFIQTAIHNYGNTNGFKGDLRTVATFPFGNVSMNDTGKTLKVMSNAVGTGATPEGIDQNPAYYEFLYEQNFRSEPILDPDHIRSTLIDYAHRRYQLASTSVSSIASAWSHLFSSVYTTDFTVQDQTGVSHLNMRGRDQSSLFELDRFTPKAMVCHLYRAWNDFIDFATDHPDIIQRNMPFRHDFVDVGREVLAQLSTPMALNFTDSMDRTKHPNVTNDTTIRDTGLKYRELLSDLDRLVSTDKGFLLGPWIQSARAWGKDNNHTDCAPSSAFTLHHPNTSHHHHHNMTCQHFYEWNARCQITTWNPTPYNSSKVPNGPIDYAAKHWSGLIRDYYVKRVDKIMKVVGKMFRLVPAVNETVIQRERERVEAEWAYEWTMEQDEEGKKFALEVEGDALVVSIALRDKYEGWFQGCEDYDDGDHEGNVEDGLVSGIGETSSSSYLRLG